MGSYELNKIVEYSISKCYEGIRIADKEQVKKYYAIANNAIYTLLVKWGQTGYIIPMDIVEFIK